MRATVISLPLPHGTAGAERLHIFSGAFAATIFLCAPAWAEALSADARFSRLAMWGTLRTLMPMFDEPVFPMVSIST